MMGAPRRWLAFAAVAAAATAGDVLEGVFLDPKFRTPRYGCGGATCESLEGVRAVHTSAEGRVTMIGADNDGIMWVALGAADTGGSGGVRVNFALRGAGLGDADGHWDGRDIVWAPEAMGAWTRASALPRLEYDAEADIQFDGVYADPDVWDGGPAGLRFVSHRTGKVDGISITAVGTNDGASFFALFGAFRIENSLFLDFTPVGGEKRVDGIQIKGAILWPDGTKWVKVRGLAPHDEL